MKKGLDYVIEVLKREREMLFGEYDRINSLSSNEETPENKKAVELLKDRINSIDRAIETLSL